MVNFNKGNRKSEMSKFIFTIIYLLKEIINWETPLRLKFQHDDTSFFNKKKWFNELQNVKSFQKKLETRNPSISNFQFLYTEYFLSFSYRKNRYVALLICFFTENNGAFS